MAIARDIAADKPIGEIAACFHATLSAAIGEVCGRIRASDAVNRVCLSGGTFQNLYLLGSTAEELRRRGFGQAMVANERGAGDV